MSDALKVLRQPKWLALLLMLPVAMALCVVAANWQYQRHVVRSAQEQRLAASQAASPVPLTSVLAPDTQLPADRRYTKVTATGQYEPTPVLIRNRRQDGERGMWVVNPLQTVEGTTILVLRGWLAATPDNVSQPEVPAAPDGPVTVTGVLEPSELKRGPGVLSNGEATSLDTAVLCPQPSCYQAYLQMTSSQPPDVLPTVPVQGPGLGPHLGYAGQWLIFMLLLPIGFVILLRREAREQHSDADAPTPSS